MIFKEIRITFTSDWGAQIDRLLESLRYYTPGHDNRWGALKGVKDAGSADYLVALNGLPPWKQPAQLMPQSLFRRIRRLLSGRARAIKEHPAKLYFQMEPPEIRQPHDSPDEFLSYCSHEHHHHVANWHVRIPFRELEALDPPADTGGLKPLSGIVSGKNQTEAQKRRLEVVGSVARRYPQTDIYGKRGSPDLFGESYKGVLNYNGNCKFRGLNGYRYSMAFENSSHRNYFTEKLIDCFLCWCKPIYWGCPNITDFFPAESMACVDLFSPDVTDRILDEMKKPVDYDAIREARNLVMHKYNIWPSIERQVLQLQESATTL